MDIFAKSPLSFKGIFRSYWRLYRKAFLKTLPLIIITGVAINSFTILNYTHQTVGINSKLLGLLLPLGLILLIPYLTSLLMLKTFHVGKDQIATLKNTIPYINKRYFKILIGTSIVLISCSIGIRFMMAPGIFLMVLFVLVQPLILLDNYGIIESLTKSAKLVWGNWWQTFAVVFPFIFVNYLTADLTAEAFKNGNWQTLLIIGSISTLFFSLLYVSILVVFNDLKLRKNVANIVTIDSQG